MPLNEVPVVSTEAEGLTVEGPQIDLTTREGRLELFRKYLPRDDRRDLAPTHSHCPHTKAR